MTHDGGSESDETRGRTLLDDAIATMCAGRAGVLGQLREAVAHAPSLGPAVAWLAIEEAKNGDRKRSSQYAASARAQLAEQLDGDQAVTRALLLELEGDVRGALAQMEQVLAQDYDNRLLLERWYRLRLFSGGNCWPYRLELGTQRAREVGSLDPYLLARRAFACTFLERYREAESLASEAFHAAPHNAHVSHIFAHVLHETGRAGEALAHLEDWLEEHGDWRSLLYGHMWWHCALVYMGRLEYEKSLSIYDTHCRPSCGSADASLALADAVGFLWRLSLRGHPVDARSWNEALALARQLAQRPVTPFTAMHVAMAFAGSTDGNQELCNGALGARLRASIDDNVETIASVVDAIRDFATERYDRSVQHLNKICHHGFRAIGGSNIERQILRETLLEARLRSEEPSSDLVFAASALVPRAPRAFELLQLLRAYPAGRAAEAAVILDEVATLCERGDSNAPERSMLDALRRAIGTKEHPT